MTQQDLQYRKEHTVVPQLDFFNGAHNNIAAPPVQYSQFAAMGNVVKVDARQVASGIGDAFTGALNLAAGDGGYGLGKTISGLFKTFSGVVNPNYVQAQKTVCEMIQQSEEVAWERRWFLEDFVPAEGQLGDIVCDEGEFDECFCGHGHRFFTNGDYFEGIFMDGQIREGLYIFADGTRYLGKFDESLHFVDRGLIWYADGTVYDGEFVGSMRHGVGAMWYPDGVYVGNWSNNVRHGFGYLRQENNFFEGYFDNGQPVRD